MLLNILKNLEEILNLDFEYFHVISIIFFNSSFAFC